MSCHIIYYFRYVIYVICQNQIQKSSANSNDEKKEQKFVELKEMPKSESCKWKIIIDIKPGYGIENDAYEYN